MDCLGTQSWKQITTYAASKKSRLPSESKLKLEMFRDSRNWQKRNACTDEDSILIGVFARGVRKDMFAASVIWKHFNGGSPMSELTDFRKHKDHFFKTDPESPLTVEQKKTFRGLVYFPENPALRFEIPLEKYAQPEHVRMQTSTGAAQDYHHVGQIRFRVNGQEATLQVYGSEHGNDYFIPFVDATAPEETYGAGRYLEPEDLGNGKLLLDLNLAYNPYCAYNERWSCPIPPKENRLSVRIEAGEKKFHDQPNE